jgi:uncharacterized membrane protein YhiD involved in acid resistance
MLTTGQIVIRLLVSLIFGIILGVFLKKEKFFSFKVYPLLSMTATLTALTLIEILLKIYSKVELALLPAALILGLFLMAKTILKLNEKVDETIFNLTGLLLTMLVGFSLGFGFYRPAIFGSLLALIFITFLPNIEEMIKKIWPFNKR